MLISNNTCFDSMVNIKNTMNSFDFNKIKSLIPEEAFEES